MHHRFRPGQLFPDFALPDHTQTLQRLSDLQGDEPMLVVLIRGFDCPKDREQLRELTRCHAQRGVPACRLLVITGDEWHTARELRGELGADYPFLCDPAGQVRSRLGIVADGRDGEREPMIPHTVLLAAGRLIHKLWSGAYHWSRPSPCEVHDAVRELTSGRGHPLFDLATRAPRREARPPLQP